MTVKRWVSAERRWRRRASRLRPLILAAALFASALPGTADLAVFTNGHVLKISDFKVNGDMVRMVLASGGSLLVPLTVIERVLDDEIVPDVEVEVSLLEPSLVFSEASEIPETPFGDLIHDTARRHGVSSDLVAAMVRAESAFDPRAVSHKGARGLLQLMPATAMRFGVPPESLFDPEKNLEAGVSYLKWLVGRYSDTPTLVLAAYNAGEGSVERFGGVPPYRETREYIRRIYSSLGLEVGSGFEATR